jgi:hypothetical protein
LRELRSKHCCRSAQICNSTKYLKLVIKGWVPRANTTTNGANPAIVSYNAKGVKNYNITNSLVRLESNYFTYIYHLDKSVEAYYVGIYNADDVVSCKFRSLRIGNFRTVALLI